MNLVSMSFFANVRAYSTLSIIRGHPSSKLMTVPNRFLQSSMVDKERPLLSKGYCKTGRSVFSESVENIQLNLNLNLIRKKLIEFKEVRTNPLKVYMSKSQLNLNLIRKKSIKFKEFHMNPL